MINTLLKVDSDRNSLLEQHSFSDNGGGYAVAWVNGKKQYMHHLVLPKKEGFVVDHINGNKYDNRRENLRLITQRGNAINAKISKNNRSGQAGVFFDARINKWLARISPNGKSVHLGSFESIEDAIQARKKAERDYGFDIWKKANKK